MAKKRTGLQSQISAIFSGVPIPKKGGSGEGPPGAPSQAAGPERPQPKIPPAPGAAPPKFHPPVEPVREIPPAKAAAPRVPEPRIGQIPTVPRRKKEKLVAPQAGTSSARQKIAVAMVVILSILLVVLLVRPFQGPSSRPAASGTTGQAKAGISSKTNIRIDWPVPQKYPEDQRDPMILAARQEVRVEKPGALVVTAITSVYNDAAGQWQTIVVVGTDMLGEGDTVPDTKIKVIKINPDSVEFEDETGKRWTQKVQGENTSNK